MLGMRSLCRLAPRRCRFVASAPRPAVPHSRAFRATACVSAKVHNKHIDETYNTADTPFEFTAESKLAIEDVLSKYPSNYPQSACIPVLWIAQKQHGGWLPLAAMDKTADVCKMPPILVYEVATFYTMFNRWVSIPPAPGPARPRASSSLHPRAPA